MDNYNDEPVEYCESCLDLKIREMGYLDTNGRRKVVPFCGNCGSGNIDKTHISNWEELYYDRYGHTYAKGDKQMANPSGEKGIGDFM